ncbi:MAG: DUF58 domain-containing protein [Halobacteria archaeon]
MKFGDRYRRAAVLAVTLLVLSVVLQQAALLFAATGIASVLLVREANFAYLIWGVYTDLNPRLSVEQETVHPDTSIKGEFSAELEGTELPKDTELSVEFIPPISFGLEDSIEIDAGVSSESTAGFRLEPSFLGNYDIGDVVFEIIDEDGYFSTRRETSVDDRIKVTVQDRVTGGISLVRGGEEVATVGGNEMRLRGSGNTAASTRKYTTSDPARLIDWKATSRLNEVYTREREATTSKNFIYILDHGASTAKGEPGERKIEVLRETAYSFFEHSVGVRDPVGFYSYTEETVTDAYPPTDQYDRYRKIRKRILNVEAEQKDGQIQENGSVSGYHRNLTNTAGLNRGSGDGFDRKIGAYLVNPGTSGGSHVGFSGETGLSTVLGRHSGRWDRNSWVQVFTDASNREELEDAVKRLATTVDRITVFIAPDVLFGPVVASDIEERYQNYIELQRFMKTLGSIRGVDVFSVSPRERRYSIVKKLQDRLNRETEA